MRKYAFWIAAALLFAMIFNIKSKGNAIVNIAFQDTTKSIKTVVSFTPEEWQQRINWLEYIKTQLKRTDLPAREVGFMSDSLLSKFQNEIISQVVPQIKKESPKK